MVRLVPGFVATFAALIMLGRLGVVDWGFPLTMLGFAPVMLAGGLLMGLHEDPPPWRRRGAAR